MITRHPVRLLAPASWRCGRDRSRAPASAADGVRVLRAWDRTLRSRPRDAGPRRARLRLRAGLAFEQIYDVQGQLMERRPGRRIPTPSGEEIDEAIAIRLRRPQSRSRHRCPQPTWMVASSRESAGKPCGPHSRCLQIFAFRTERRRGPAVPSSRQPERRTAASSIVHRDGWDRGCRD